MSDKAKVKVPVRLDGEMLSILLKKFPDSEIQIHGVVFALDGVEFHTETLEGAMTVIREVAKPLASVSASGERNG